MKNLKFILAIAMFLFFVTVQNFADPINPAGAWSTPAKIVQIEIWDDHVELLLEGHTGWLVYNNTVPDFSDRGLSNMITALLYLKSQEAVIQIWTLGSNSNNLFRAVKIS